MRLSAAYKENKLINRITGRNHFLIVCYLKSFPKGLMWFLSWFWIRFGLFLDPRLLSSTLDTILNICHIPF